MSKPLKKIYVLLVEPEMSTVDESQIGKDFFGFSEIIEPIGLCYIAGAIEKELKDIAEVEIFQRSEKTNDKFRERILEKLERRGDASYDKILVGFKTLACNSAFVMDALEKLKEKLSLPLAEKTFFFIGGPYATHYYTELEEQLKHRQKHDVVDFAILGEGEKTLVQLISDLLEINTDETVLERTGVCFFSNRLHPLKQKWDKDEKKMLSRRVHDWGKYVPRRKDLPMDIYFPQSIPPSPFNAKKGEIATVLISRGCAGKCIFCDNNKTWGNDLRKTKNEMVISRRALFGDGEGGNHYGIINEIIDLALLRGKYPTIDIKGKRIKYFWFQDNTFNLFQKTHFDLLIALALLKGNSKEKIIELLKEIDDFLNLPSDGEVKNPISIKRVEDISVELNRLVSNEDDIRHLAEIKWGAMGRWDNFFFASENKNNEPEINKELFNLYAIAGCQMFSFGIEFYEKRKIKGIKGIDIPLDGIRQLYTSLLNNGIFPNSFFILGMPSLKKGEIELDNESEWEKILEFNRNIPVARQRVTFYTPFRGTELGDIILSIEKKSKYFIDEDIQLAEFSTEKPIVKVNSSRENIDAAYLEKRREYLVRKLYGSKIYFLKLLIHLLPDFHSLNDFDDNKMKEYKERFLNLLYWTRIENRIFNPFREIFDKIKPEAKLIPTVDQKRKQLADILFCIFSIGRRKSIKTLKIDNETFGDSRRDTGEEIPFRFFDNLELMIKIKQAKKGEEDISLKQILWEKLPFELTYEFEEYLNVINESKEKIQGIVLNGFLQYIITNLGFGVNNKMIEPKRIESDSFLNMFRSFKSYVDFTDHLEIDVTVWKVREEDNLKFLEYQKDLTELAISEKGLKRLDERFSDFTSNGDKLDFSEFVLRYFICQGIQSFIINDYASIMGENDAYKKNDWLFEMIKTGNPEEKCPEWVTGKLKEIKKKHSLTAEQVIYQYGWLIKICDKLHSLTQSKKDYREKLFDFLCQYQEQINKFLGNIQNSDDRRQLMNKIFHEFLPSIPPQPWDFGFTPFIFKDKTIVSEIDIQTYIDNYSGRKGEKKIKELNREKLFKTIYQYLQYRIVVNIEYYITGGEYGLGTSSVVFLPYAVDEKPFYLIYVGVKSENLPSITKEYHQRLTTWLLRNKEFIFQLLNYYTLDRTIERSSKLLDESENPAVFLKKLLKMNEKEKLFTNNKIKVEEKSGNLIFVNEGMEINESLYLKWVSNKLIQFFDRYNDASVSRETKSSLLKKISLISILVDSFAHNISAHSLATLKWWFETRAKFIYDKEIWLEDITVGTKLEKAAIRSLKDFYPSCFCFELKKVAEQKKKHLETLGLEGNSNKDSTSLLGLIQSFNSNAEEKILSYQAVDENDKKVDIFRYPVPIDHAMWHFIRFMRDKASFWSGVTRDLPFGGESKNLYKVFWNDFAQNPLYLGTIAHSEGILKLNIHIDLPGIEGTDFATIDMSVIEWEKEIAGNQKENMLESHKTNESGPGKSQEASNRNYSKYAFVRLGENHSDIRTELQKSKYDVFFPGGIVGEHALFTLLENTLRNVKHYKNSSDWKNIQDNGISLRISIRPSRLMSNDEIVEGDENHEIFQFEIGFEHNTSLLNSKGEKVTDELVNLTQKPIINISTGRPRLGGNAQDKICAAMLFNNTFISVDKIFESEETNERDEFYCNGKNLNWIGFRESPTRSNPKIGKITKYFYLWKSNFFYKANSIKDFENENVSRFKFVYIPKTAEKPDEIFKTARDEGVVRILTNSDIDLTDDEIKEMTDETARHIYKAWLDKFLFERKAIIMGQQSMPTEDINYIDGSTPSIMKITDNSISEIENTDLDNITLNDWILLDFAHGTNHYPREILDYRSHGSLVKYFYIENNKLPIRELKYHEEFIEVLFTKIFIFDDRLYSRIPEEKYDLYENKLNLVFNKENRNQEAIGYGYSWNKFVNEKKVDVNILVMHLSFIEALDYTEEEIDDFVDTLNIANEEKFILVITTGRGRYQWKEELKKEYARFTIFRPIESLLSAVEEAVSLKDDFQVKFNLMKVILGS